MASQNIYEAGLALNGLANFIHADLARDLANDIIAMMSSVRSLSLPRFRTLRHAYTCARSLHCSPTRYSPRMWLRQQVFLVYPDALRPAFPRLKDKLEDTDPSVQVLHYCDLLIVVLRRKRDLRIGPEESQELPLAGARLLQGFCLLFLRFQRLCL